MAEVNDNELKSNKTEFFEKWWFYLIIVGVIFLIWAASAFFLVHASFDNTNGDIWTIRGTFGDMFGAVNALFSGLAFGGMIITLLMQRKELKLQREELTKTTKELEGQKKIMEMQQKVANIQCFENGFYQMLSKHREILNSFNYKKIIGLNKPQEFQGAPAVDILYTDYCLGIQNAKDTLISEKLEFYYKQLYGIVRFIAESELLKNKNSDREFLDRYYYMTLLRVNLSDSEWGLVYIRALDQTREKFKKYIEEYALLKDVYNIEQINAALQRDNWHPNTNYERSAFGIDDKITQLESSLAK